MRGELLGFKKFIALYLLLPVVLDIIIESLNRKSFFAGVAYMTEKPSLFLFNVLIIMLTLSVAKFFSREIFVVSMISIVWLFFGVVNYVILQFRVTPFSAVDFTLISSAISVSGHYLTMFNVAMIVLASLILVVSCVCLFKKAPRFQGNATRRAYILSTGTVLVLLCCILVMHRSSSSVQALSDNYTNISEAYENYGFVYCFANSLLDTGISKPEDYSQETVEEIRENLQETEDGQERPNIVMVQLESFFDICGVEGISFSQDPLPNFHLLQQSYSHGQLTVPTVGAGTVNTEFEVLTGMSQHDFGTGEYPYKTVLKNKTSESICNDLAGLGYTSHAVHNNTATFYGRNKVFSNLGFDSFTSVEYMNDVSLNPNGWAKDDIMVQELVKTLDATEGADFTFGITVQSHGKYSGISQSGQDTIQVYNAPEGQEDAYSYYVNQLYQVDQMIGSLVSKLSRRQEPTILVLYGDHLPSLDLTAEDLSDGSLYETQYIVWNNYGLETRNQDLAAYQLYSQVLDMAGIHQGVITKYHQQSDWDSQDYLTGLTTLEYDLLYGENYLYGGENPFQASDLAMGTDKIRITDVTSDGEDSFLVTGKGFTPYCKVYFDGRELDSQWVDSGHIRINGQIRKSSRRKQKGKQYDPDEIPNTFVVEVQNGDGVKLSYSNVLRWKKTSVSSGK